MIHEISIEITLCDSNIILSINLDIEVLLFYLFSDVFILSDIRSSPDIVQI